MKRTEMKTDEDESKN